MNNLEIIAANARPAQHRPDADFVDISFIRFYFPSPDAPTYAAQPIGTFPPREFPDMASALDWIALQLRD